MIVGDKSLGKTVEPGPSTIGKDGVIQQGKPSGPPHEGSRETYEGRIISVPRDFCWTPVGSGKILIGYKIWAFQREATNLADSVTQTSLRSHVKGSIIKHCYGDERGTLGGFFSHTHNAECTPKTWSETVTFEGRNAVRDGDEWWMNHYNTWGVLDYKKDMNQYSTSDPKQIDAKLYMAQYAGPSPAAAAEGPVGAAAAAAPMAGRAAMAFGQGLYGALPNKTDTIQSYLMRPYYNLTGGVPENTSPPPLTPPSPEPPSPPPLVPPAVQPSSPPPTEPVAQPSASPPPSEPAEQMPTSPPPSEAQGDNGPTITETRRLSVWQKQNGINPNAVRQTHSTNPCASLAAGKNGGGSYGKVGGHHMPARAISSIPEAWGPAIQIDPADHALLPSTNAQSTLPSMKAQGALAQQDFMQAFENDVKDIQNLFGNKYDAQIADARAYANCLKKSQLVS